MVETIWCSICFPVIQAMFIRLFSPLQGNSQISLLTATGKNKAHHLRGIRYNCFSPHVFVFQMATPIIRNHSVLNSTVAKMFVTAAKNKYLLLDSYDLCFPLFTSFFLYWSLFRWVFFSPTVQNKTFFFLFCFTSALIFSQLLPFFLHSAFPSCSTEAPKRTTHKQQPKHIQIQNLIAEE